MRNSSSRITGADQKSTRSTPQPPLAPEPLTTIEDIYRAHRLLIAAQYHPASDLSSRIAALLAGHQHFRRAAHLYFQAMTATLKGNHHTLARAQADRAIAALLQFRDLPYAARLLKRIDNDLRTLTFASEAQLLVDIFQARLDEQANSINTADSTTPTSNHDIPDHCNACLGSLHSGDLQWTDTNTAQYPFCGSAITPT